MAFGLYIVRVNRISYIFCDKPFNRGFNLRRHEKYCPLKDQERKMSKTESQTMGSEDNFLRPHWSESR